MRPLRFAKHHLESNSAAPTLKDYISICRWVIYIASKAPLNSGVFLVYRLDCLTWPVPVCESSVWGQWAIQWATKEGFSLAGAGPLTSLLGAIGEEAVGGVHCGREVMTFWHPGQTERHAFISSYSGGASQKTSNCFRVTVPQIV